MAQEDDLRALGKVMHFMCNSQEELTWPKIWSVLFSGFVFFFLN